MSDSLVPPLPEPLDPLEVEPPELELPELLDPPELELPLLVEPLPELLLVEPPLDELLLEELLELPLAGSAPSSTSAPLLVGSSQKLRLVSGVGTFEKFMYMRPYQSGVSGVSQEDSPPDSCPTSRCSRFQMPEPELPPSVTPRSQSAIMMWVGCSAVCGSSGW